MCLGHVSTETRRTLLGVSFCAACLWRWQLLLGLPCRGAKQRGRATLGLNIMVGLRAEYNGVYIGVILG